MQLKPDFSHNSEYYHGSCSSSLVGFSNAEKPGLVCTGDLLDQDLVPFSGELERGIINTGVNREGISTVDLYNIGDTIRYTGAHPNQSRLFYWRPDLHDEIQRRNQQGIHKNLQGLRQVNVVDDLEHAEEMADYYGDKLDRFKRSQIINQRRRQIYSSLNWLDKQAVLKRFPVIYGVSQKGMMQRIAQSSSREFILPPYIPAEQTVLYVPQSQIDFTHKFLNKKEVEVGGVRTFNDLADHYLDHLHLSIEDPQQLVEHLSAIGSVAPDGHANAIQRARGNYQKTADSIRQLDGGDYQMNLCRNLAIEARWKLNHFFKGAQNN